MSSAIGKQQWQMCAFVLIILLVKTGQGTPSFYVIREQGQSDEYGRNGIYEEKKEPELFFQKLGEANSAGAYQFLYRDSRRPNSWIHGEGANLISAVALHRAPAVEGRPSVTNWS